MFASLHLAGDSLTYTGNGDSSVPPCRSGSELVETVCVKADTFARETGIINLTGIGLERTSCSGEAIHQL